MYEVYGEEDCNLLFLFVPTSYLFHIFLFVEQTWNQQMM